MRSFLFILSFLLAAPAAATERLNPDRFPQLQCSICGVTSYDGTSVTLTVPLGLPDGTAGAPSLYFTSDPDTGYYLDAAGTHRWSIGGSLKMYLVAGSLGLSGTNLNMAGNLIYDSTRATALGTACAAAGTTGNACTGGDLTVDGDITTNDITFAAYTRHHDLNAGALASVGAGAPNFGCCGSLCGAGLNNVNEILFEAEEIPPEWDGASNMTLLLHVAPSDSDPFANGEDVDIDFSWRSMDPDTETGKSGSAAVDTATYTQSGAGTECDIIILTVTVPYTGGNQPLTSGDRLGVQFYRDTVSESSSYSGELLVVEYELTYTAVGKATH